LFHLVLEAGGGTERAKAVHLATFCLLYTSSLDLFDDMQDDDLAGKPHAAAGPAIAVNSAIALLFLALDELRLALALESRVGAHQRYLEIFNRISLVTVGAQHADLLGDQSPTSPAEVLDMHRGKTASIALFLECAALAANGASDVVDAYGAIGRELAGLIQIVDDVRDIYGKDESPDLSSGKRTYPLACFHELAGPAERRRLAELNAATSCDLEAIRELLHEVGAIDRCAADVDGLRRSIHRAVARLSRWTAHHRIVLDIVDAVAATLYEPEPIEETAFLYSPETPFDVAARRAFREFCSTIGQAIEDLPRLAPWHLPYFMFDAERQVVFYPDVDGLPDEVLPFHEALMDESREVTRMTLLGLLPALLAHELTHALRERAQLLTEDHWHEEYVANRLATGFLGRRSSAESRQVKLVAERLVQRNGHLLDEAALNIVERSAAHSDVPPGYGVSAEQAALVHWEMVRRLLDESPDLSNDVATYLGYGLEANAAE
jgi:geranylgeranyl pyrophosphate synthase